MVKKGLREKYGVSQKFICFQTDAVKKICNDLWLTQYHKQHGIAALAHDNSAAKALPKRLSKMSLTSMRLSFMSLATMSLDTAIILNKL